MTTLPLAQTAHIKTMSSLEIAELTGKQHSHVLRDIKNILAEAGIDESKFGRTYKDASNRDKPRYELPRRECDLVIAGYSVKYRLAIIDRWQELETQQAFKLPKTLPEALRQLADETEAKERALVLVEQQQQTIERKDELIKVSNEASVKAGEILIREFVKSQDLIDIGEKQFYAWMREQKIVFSEHNEPYQRYVDAGFFTYKPTEIMYGGKYRHTVRVTPRGKVWLAARYMKYHDAMMLENMEEAA